MVLWQGVMSIYVLTVCLLFFVNQKTAYEMRISDWSSDVCSSDLAFAVGGVYVCPRRQLITQGEPRRRGAIFLLVKEIGRASLGKECVSTCRSRWSPSH